MPAITPETEISMKNTKQELLAAYNKLLTQQESAYQKIQDVAVKAIEGASQLGSFEGRQRIMPTQGETQTGENRFPHK